MEEIHEKKTVRNGAKQNDPNVAMQKLRFWARFLISLLAFSLFGWLVITMINKPDELAQSSKDLINLAFGAFLPIIGMLGKHWFETEHEPIINSDPPPKKGSDGNDSVETS